ncbi:PAAR-like protein [Pedobacter sp. WC2423]|uniref:PAAR-like protein n=1 Tax=Pedobacter sp. WC2423 TaxID=3234142 RepID=UPI003467E653
MAKDDLYVPEGAFLKCDMGAMIMTLKVTPKKHNLYGLPIATETDKIPLLNIPCFVTCSVNGSACTPVGTEWKNTHDGAQKVLGKAPLLKSSYCKCQKGGTITIFLDKKEAIKALEDDKTNRVDGIPWLDGAIGAALTGPVGLVVDAFTDGGHDVTEGIGRGLRKGLKSSWNGLVGMVTHPIDTVKGIGTMAGIVIVGYGGGPLTYPISSPAERLKKFDETFGTSLKNTHDAIGDAVVDTWDKKVVNGTTEERSELGGQLIEAVAEAVVGTKGAGLAVKGVGAGAKFALGAERLAELTATITKLRNAMKLEGLMAKVKGIFKVGRNNTQLIDDVTKRAAQEISLFSKTKNGPCLSAVYDPVTGKTFFGKNFTKNLKGKAEYAKFVEDAHPLVKKRILARQKLIDEGKVPIETDLRAGGHSEVRALDDAIKAREAATSKPVTETDLSTFDLHNRRLPDNIPMHRCPNCSVITDGVKTVGGHK